MSRLTESFEETHGYPAGDNKVALADDEASAALTLLTNHRPECVALLSFFVVIDSVSLPDIGNGYFIHPPSTVTAHLDEYGAVSLANSDHGIVFGSDGGGNLFVLMANGTVHKSRTASWNDEFYAVSASLGDFLEQLRDAIEQFAAMGGPGAL
ncbi:SMI1/KNR4 family protein [Streptomyces sp. NBC_01361]|uniref:SMI1/KNR4 family protein n=1 Tax=Streptomyces sp. NBC_01361 TaxID=2903838 RepID=UPI002E321B8A|nr:SMI1/KNR4 family protein [Streptomyces sp. NBC_01361]